MQRNLLKYVAGVSFFLVLAGTAIAQGVPESQNGSATVTVYVRTMQGNPISAGSHVTLNSMNFGIPVATGGQTTGDGWVFTGVQGGDEYDVEVTADGYEPGHEDVLVAPESGFSVSVTVFLKPANGKPLFRPPGGQFVLAPRAQKEVEKGLKDLQSGNKASARKHFSNAVQMAPGDPYANYLMGMGFLLDNQLSAASPYLEKAVSIDSKQVAAVHALGALRVKQHNYTAAIDALNRAIQLDPTSWKSHWLLAECYLEEHDFAPAQDHAEKALRFGKEPASQVQMLLGEALYGLGENEKAKGALEIFVKQHPNDRNAPMVRGWIEHLQQLLAKANSPAAVTVAEHVTPPAESLTVVTSPIVDLPPKEDWAPVDIDAEKPFVISGVACSLPRVLSAAAKNAKQLVHNLQQFTATEEYQSVEIKRNENLEKPEVHKFDYLVTISNPNPELIQVDEIRDQGIGTKDVPGRLVDLGAPALVLAFHPLFQSDFTWSCEGLGEWKDKPAWIVRFRQRPDRPGHLANFQASSGTYGLSLKGLAWISENGGEVMHMETDLAKPVAAAKLQRQHFVIDYEPVKFRTHKVTLWLPEHVDVYFQFRGHYLHHSHDFSNFKLFWVGSSQDIAKPKETPPPR
ncbi:MAG TPA: tetratricopeptide repeat protein [Candidatus Acidoferrales bacterium]|nr:tetratricopeptide repeat protein [Candidatus Acidoferrales bacterium]